MKNFVLFILWFCVSPLVYAETIAANPAASAKTNEEALSNKNPPAEEILNKTLANYKHLESYVSKGEIISTLKDKKRPMWLKGFFL